MAKMITYKKGIFFTLSIFFLLPAIITVWTLTSMETNLEGSFVLDRIYDLSSSVKSCIREIFDHYYDSSIFIEEDSSHINITFIENISGNKDIWGAEFNAIINNFRDFVEAEEPSIDINISGLQEKETPTVIEPYNITYSRTWGTGHVTIKVVPQEINFGSYDVIINSSSLQIDNVSTQFRNPGTFSFTVIAVDNYGHKIINTAKVDPADNHQVQVFFVGGNKAKITLIGNILETWTNTPNNLIVSTKIDGLDKTASGIRIGLFKNVINVSFPAFKAEKIDSVDIIVQVE